MESTSPQESSPTTETRLATAQGVGVSLLVVGLFVLAVWIFSDQPALPHRQGWRDVAALTTLLLGFSVVLVQMNRRWALLSSRANLALREEHARLHRLLGEKERAESEARRSRELLQTAVSHAPLVLFMLDRNYVFQLSVGKGLNAVGMKQNQSAGHSVRTVYAGFPDFLQSLDQAMAGAPAEYRIRVRGRVFHGYLNPLLDDHESVQGVIGLAMDVTEQLATQQELRASEERFRTLMEQSPLSKQIFDADGNSLAVNSSWERLWESHREDSAGYNLFQDVHWQATGLLPLLRRAFEGEAVSIPPRRYDPRDHGKAGNPRWTQGLMYPLKDPDGRVREVVLVQEDITERREAEEEIRNLNASLEHKVRERTAQLEDAVRELEAFSYSVSHDLRAPLRHIGGFVELLSKRAAPVLDADSLRYVGIISESVQRMDKLISELLSFSRMSRQELLRSRFNLSESVGQCIRELDSEVQNRHVTWKLASLPDAVGDQTLLRQVLANLLSNAVKFTRLREEACIEVGSQPDGEGSTAYFVRDNGVGFDMKYVDKLFGVFQRLHGASQFEGTGIGLANVRRIINRHGGRVWAEGRPGEGAVFYFSLPN